MLQARSDRHLCTWPECGKTYAKACKLEEHLRSHTNTRPFTCSECAKSFLRKGHLKRHMTTAHTDLKPFICKWKECGRAFSLKHHLRRHERTHENDCPFRCTVESCEGAFSRKEQLKRHQQTCHSIFIDGKEHPPKIKTYICGVEGCQGSFDKWTSLLRHRRQEHTSELSNVSMGEIVCPECGRCFAKQRYLKLHTQRLHSGNPKVAASKITTTCDWDGCGRQFSSRNALRVHRATFHQGIKAYACERCDCRFGHKHLLVRHRRIHEPTAKGQNIYVNKGNEDNVVDGELQRESTWLDQLLVNETRLYPCPFPGCNSRYGRDYDLERHMEAVHWEELFDQAISPMFSTCC